MLSSCVEVTDIDSKPVAIYFHAFDHLSPYAEAKLFEFVCQLISIHQVDGRGPIPGGFAHGISGKGSGFNKRALSAQCRDRNGSVCMVVKIEIYGTALMVSPPNRP